MLNGAFNVQITKDLTGDILKSLKELESKNICIGVPEEENASREVKSNESITNAELLYIHTNGIRDTSMIRAMQHDINTGMPYSKAHELYVHENGSPLWHSPPRPVLEPAIEDGKELVAKEMKKALDAVLNGDEITIPLENIGMLGQNLARKWFTNPKNKWAPNSKDTIKRKGSDKPLIDTGELRKSITFVIKDGADSD